LGSVGGFFERGGLISRGHPGDGDTGQQQQQQPNANGSTKVTTKITRLRWETLEHWGIVVEA